jgi:hypothetical protein
MRKAIQKGAVSCILENKKYLEIGLSNSFRENRQKKRKNFYQQKWFLYC